MLAHGGQVQVHDDVDVRQDQCRGAEQKNQRGRQQTGPGGASLNLHVVPPVLGFVGAAFGGGEHFLHRDRPMLLLLHVEHRDVLLRLDAQPFFLRKDEILHPVARGDGGPLLGGGVVEERLRIDAPRLTQCDELLNREGPACVSIHGAADVELLGRHCCRIWGKRRAAASVFSAGRVEGRSAERAPITSG